MTTTPITAIAFRRIENILTSLSDSTWLRIALRGETVEFDRRCSEYTSHKTIAVSQGHGIARLAVLSSRRYSIALTSRYGQVETVRGKTHEMPIPSHYFRGLFDFPAKAPSWFEGLVKAVIPDDFEGFDDEGKPLFTTFNTVVLEGPCGPPKWDSRREFILQKGNDPDPGEEIGTVGCTTVRWDGSFLDLGRYGRYQVGDILMENAARAYDELDPAMSDHADRIISKAGLILQCTGPGDDCNGKCKECEFNLQIRVNKAPD